MANDPMTNELRVFAIQTGIYRPAENLTDFVLTHLRGRVGNGDILAITSKIVSLSEHRLVSKNEISKRDLVIREADVYLGEGGYGVELTVKNGLLIPSAGIDESNSESDQYILYPEDPYASASRIGVHLRRELGLRQLGVLLTDSHTLPLRRGVTGISLAHWGIRATEALAGMPDLFGRKLQFTSVDVVDSLAAMAVFVMGEADNRCPLAVISGAKVEFTDQSSPDEIAIELETDLYYPLLKSRLPG